MCRAIIADAGWADRFEHGTGHGVGLDLAGKRRDLAGRRVVVTGGRPAYSLIERMFG